MHLSDLHRSPSDPVDNDTLLSSLLQDRDRYTRSFDGVGAPDAIMVSGDVIQGAYLNAKEWQRDVEEQYHAASEFLSSLCDLFLDGDRSKLILVPGNHDVCWNSAIAAMERIDDPELCNKIPPNEFFNPSGDYRWSWKERAVYKIVDRQKYDDRLRAYRKFEREFYGPTNLKIPLNPDPDFNLFELDEGRILVAGFNSTYGNDCFAFHGAVSPGAVGRCNLAIRKLDRVPDLKIAVWHHGMYAPPSSSDYIDQSFVHELIGCEFQLGLHGHQHIAALNAHYIHLPEQVSIPVISAGSLCAGRRELPVGHNRQYNLIKLDETRCEGQVYIRERGTGEQFQACSKPEFGTNGALDIKCPTASNRIGGSQGVHAKATLKVVERAEAHIDAQNFDAAISLLKGLNVFEQSYERQLFLRALEGAEKHDLIVETFTEFLSERELFALIEAQRARRAFGEALSLIESGKSVYPHLEDQFEELISKIKLHQSLKK
ncbi:MAG: metallophosphoesterase [Pseudomonadota bacterium]